MQLEQSWLKDLRVEPFAARNLISTPLISRTPLLMKTIKIEVLEKEGLLEIIFVTLGLTYQSLMAASNRRTTLIGYKPLRGSLNSMSIMMRKLLRCPF